MSDQPSNNEHPMRSSYLHFYEITTRWSDNDIYGHVNNVVYYSYFDTAVNHYLIHHGELDIHTGNIVGFVVGSRCSYHHPVSYPEKIEVGLRAEHIGNSSVRYGLGIFKAGSESLCAHGTFVHVFVDRKSNRPVSIPASIRTALEKLNSNTYTYL
jgi:acyl-CoA thioester hydrolase